MMPSQVAELKQRGAIEAAQDPSSPVTAEDAARKVVEEARKAGSEALEFDPNATPEQKAAQARSHIPPSFHHHRKPNAATLASDNDTTPSVKYDLPPPSKEGVITDVPTTPITDKRASGDIDRWARVGWAPRFGQGGNADDDGTTLLDHQTWLEANLDDKFYGDWYHNTGVIIFACLMSWVVAVLGGGLGWVFIVMAICGTYYRTSIRRVRRNFRDDVNREMAKARLETDTESLEWINSFLVKFWPIYAPVLCETIVASVDQVLSTSTPSFLESLKMKEFVLGTKPPRLEHVKTYPKAQDDIVLMDWKFSFTPNDTSDLTARQIKHRVNPKIILEVRVGKGVVSKGLDVIVEDMAFSGLMRVKFKLQLPFPHIEKVDICFLERPTIDYVCKPLGGETFGFDINFIPGLETFIMEMIHATLAPMMYDPNVFPIEIAKMLAGNPVDQAIGVLQITFHGAQGLKNPDKFSGTPDPYASVSINNREELAKTKTIHENPNPRWGETINIILTSLKDSLTINVFDYNEFRKDKELGTAAFALEQLEDESEHENLQLELMSNGRPRGIVQADIRFFPVLESVKLEDGTSSPPPESNSGIVKFTVERAKELDGGKSMIGHLNPYAVLLLNGKEVHVSKKPKRTNSPVWPDGTKELLIHDRKKARLGLVIKDDRDLAADPIIGQYQIKLDDLLEYTAKGHDWFNLAGVKTGRAKMTAQWKPVALKGTLGGSGGYVTPIGVLRLHFKNARDLRNVETMGKSDPYVRILLSGVEKCRTVTFRNDLNPDWDEVLYVPVHTTREKILIEVMDQENLGKDRSLGHTEISVAEYVKQDENREYMINDEKIPRSDGLKMGPTSSTKGTLNYTCAFYPTYDVYDPEEEEREESRLSLDSYRRSGDMTNISLRKSVESSRDSTDTGRDKDKLARAGTISSLKMNGNDTETNTVEHLKPAEQEKPITPRLQLSPENLIEYESGLIVFKLIDGEIAEPGCHVEVLMDDMVFPSYSSSKVRAKHTTFNEVGDAMVRELDFSKITLRLIEKVDKKGEGNDDHVIAKLTGNTIDTLRRCLYTPTQLILKDNEGRDNKITVSLKYLPVKMRLDPSESFNNSGNLRVEILDAADLPAADRNGYSDPFCEFNMNGKRVYKTKVQKKTLHPAWNEYFEMQVRSRTAAVFEVNVFDWDFGEKADFLGKAAINLDILEPFQQQEVTLGLDGKSGVIRLKMLFKPNYVVRSRQGSSTFSGTFAAPGKIVGGPVKGVGKGAVLVGGTVVKGASFLGRSFKRRKSRSAADDDSEERAVTPNGSTTTPPLPTINIDGASPQLPNTSSTTPSSSPHHTRVRSVGAQSISSITGGGSLGADAGTASLAIVSASSFPPSTNIRVHVRLESPKGPKEVHKTKAIKAPSGEVTFDEAHETFTVTCTADSQFKLIVKDHATFGSDDDLGETLFFVDDQGSGGEKALKVGDGTVVIRSSFKSSDQGSGATGNSPRGLRRGVFGTKRESHH